MNSTMTTPAPGNTTVRQTRRPSAAGELGTSQNNLGHFFPAPAELASPAIAVIFRVENV